METKKSAYDHGKAAGYAQGCGTASASHWGEYLAANDKPESGWIIAMADFDRGFEDGVAVWKAEHPYSVLEFGSHPDDGNDDCSRGKDFATIDEARAAYLSIPEVSAAFVMLDGPGVREVRPNPHHRASRDDGDGEWRREIAMQAGMGLGVDGYNDAMGYS